VIRPSVQTVSDVCLKCTCSLDTSAFSALEVLDNNRALEIYLLTYVLLSVPAPLRPFRLIFRRVAEGQVK